MPTGITKDLTGKVFGDVTVIKRVGTKRYSYSYGKVTQPQWLCQCDGDGRKCKKTFVTSTQSLLSKTISCGCLRSYKKTSPVTYLFGRYKHPAASLRREFFLTKEGFSSLISRKCHYCGMLPAQKLRRILPAHSEFSYNGIDRIDNAKGYVESNVVPCCGLCNEMKSDKSHEDFLRQVEAIHDWQKGKTLSASAG